MAKARGVSGLCAAVAAVGMAVAIAAGIVALTRIAFAFPTMAELVSACRDWLLPQGGAASSWLVLALGSVGVAVVTLTVRSALRQLRDSRRFERGLRVIRPVDAQSAVLLLDDDAPQAFCVGLLRPRVYVSTGALAVLSDAESNAVIAHEAHHARRRDPLRMMVARAVADGLFFLPVAKQLAHRYAALAELAADEAAERRTGDRLALASALMTFDAHPHPAAVGIAPERVDRLLGQSSSWQLPVFLLVVAAATLLVVGAATIRLLQATDAANVTVPALLAQLCMVSMAVVPLLLGGAGVLTGRRLLRH